MNVLCYDNFKTLYPDFEIFEVCDGLFRKENRLFTCVIGISYFITIPFQKWHIFRLINE
jgi:hypothetical protein